MMVIEYCWAQGHGYDALRDTSLLLGLHLVVLVVAEIHIPVRVLLMLAVGNHLE